MYIENDIIQRIRGMIRPEYLSTTNIILKENKASYNSIVVISGKSLYRSTSTGELLFARLKATGTIQYISFSSKYKLLFNQSGIEYSEVESDMGFIRLGLDIFSPLTGYLDKLPDIFNKIFIDIFSFPAFGCCDKYVACSDAKHCLHEDLVYSTACQYRSNLEQGKIFYGKNNTIHPDYLLQMQSSWPSSYPDEYIVFDLETTGFSPNKDKIVEIAAVKYRRKEALDTYHTMVNPNCDLNPVAQHVNHIDSSMICSAPCIEDVFPQFIEFVGSLPLIAHNADFDIGFLKKAAEKLHIKISNTVFDTMKLSREAFPELKSHSLQSLIKEFNIIATDSHRALPDVQATAVLFQMCLQKLYPATKF